MMSKKTQNKYSPELKIKLLREHLVNKKSVSSLCEEHTVKPSVYYTWQKELFAQGQAVFEQRTTQKDSTSAALAKAQNKLQAKNEVLAELMEEHLSLKKQFGVI